MPETLCLQWNDFHENVKVAFQNLRSDKHFTDVTLACEDGKQVEAHKFVVASSSPFFQNLLEKNKHPHPLIYMKSLKFETVSTILDFLYSGEANVYQENLESFLAIAEDLQLKGLMGKTDRTVETPNRFQTQEIESFPANALEKEQNSNETEKNKTIALTTRSSGYLEELEIKVKSLMEKSENFYAHQNKRADRCKVCGKEGENKSIKDHIEANHLEGIAIPCNLCEKTFRSRGAFRKHKFRHH